ncbi:MAG TPA: hypothetical protein VFW53_04040 [Gallionella sp.]|nr:hypothetical protein [Gallionella sp.]
MNLATNLDEVYRACDPDKPLAATDSRYVDLSEVRGTKVIAKTIARSISRCDTTQFHQQLLTGHRGSGKSTELLRLKAELERQNFFVVYIDVEELLDLVDLDYLDVLLSIAKETENVLRGSGIMLNNALLEDLSAWFSDRVVEDSKTHELAGAVKTQAEAGTTIPFFAKLMASLTAEIKTASSRRTTTRQNLERELAVFIEKLNILIDNARNLVQQRGHKDLVLIVDGLEKMHYRLLDDKKSTHEHLFVLHAEQLKSPRCHIVYTMPISLVYNANLGNDFDSILVIQMVKTTADGMTCLRQVIANRVDIATVFEQAELVDRLTQLSGGVMRDLMRLVRLATDTDEDKISSNEIDYAETTLIREYDRLLREQEFPQVKWVKENRRVAGEEVYARMLNLRLILEYQNGERWADLHPAVTRIPWVQKRLQENG